MAGSEGGAGAKTRRPSTKDHLRKKRPLRRHVDVVMNEDAVIEYQEMTAEMEMVKQRADLAAGMGDLARSTALTAEHEELKAKVEAASEALLDDGDVVRFWFQSIGPLAYDDLIAEHPPTDEQIDAARKEGAMKPQWNEDTFMPELVAASCVEPEGYTADDFIEALKSPNWSTADTNHLMNAAQMVNIGRVQVDLGKGSGRTSASEPSSATA